MTDLWECPDGIWRTHDEAAIAIGHIVDSIDRDQCTAWEGTDDRLRLAGRA
jgi:hypothetical protein